VCAYVSVSLLVFVSVSLVNSLYTPIYIDLYVYQYNHKRVYLGVCVRTVNTNVYT